MHEEERPNEELQRARAHVAELERLLEHRSRELQTSEERLGLALDCAELGMWDCDMTSGECRFNERYHTLLGYTPGEIEPNVEGWLQLVHPEDAALVDRQFQRNLEGQEPFYVCDHRLRTKSGRWKWIQARGKVVERASDGRALRHVGVYLDIDPRKQTEQELLNNRDQLEQMVARRTAELSTANQGLRQQIAERERVEAQLRHSQKMEAIGRLAGGLAHDLNNVLCVITGNTDLALGGLTPGDPLRELLEETAMAAGRATGLIRQLLAFSRKQVVQPRVVDLCELVGSLHPMLTRLIGEDIVLRTVPGPRPARVKVDPNQIEQIVLNLAINARDAMPDGGELRLEITDVEPDRAFTGGHPGASPGPHVALSVSDTGCGMSSEVRERIFEPFFTTKEQGRGTGLGLATVFGLMEQNGGRVEVESEPGQGATFRLYFPRVPDTLETPVVGPGRAATGGNETVLVVEDEEIVRRTTVRILERLGYRVLSAGSGGDALVAAEQHEGPIHLLLADVVMPHMNGRELAARLVQTRPETRVLYSSGYTRDVIAQQGVLEDGVHHISKPYTVQELAARVREALG